MATVEQQVEHILRDFDAGVANLPQNLYSMLDMFSQVYKSATDVSLSDSQRLSGILKIRDSTGAALVSTSREARELLRSYSTIPWTDVWSATVAPQEGGGSDGSSNGGGILDHINNALSHAESFLDEIDAANKEFAETRGLLLFENGPINIVVPPGIPIPPKLLVNVLYSIVEVLRILVTVTPLAPPFASVALTCLVFLADVARGKWKHGLLTLAGLFGRYALFFSVGGKVLLGTFEMLNPDVRDRMLGIINDVRASLTMGFVLWGIDVLLPGPARAALQKIHETAEHIAAQIDDKLATAENTARRTLEPVGKTVDLPRFGPLVQQYDVTNLTTLQKILTNPRINCNPEVRDLIAEAKKFTVVWMLFSVLGIPPSNADSEAECKAINDVPWIDEVLPKPEIRPLAAVATEAATPTSAETSTPENNPTLHVV